MTRIDHISWTVRPENIKRYVEQLEALLAVKFDHQYGPDVSGRDLDGYLCWDAGLELVAPLGSATELTAMISKRLEEHGEGRSTLVVGVPDLDVAAERARSLGYTVGEQIQHPDPAERLRRIRKYTNKVDDVREIPVGQFLGMRLLLGQITYPKGVNGAADDDRVDVVADQRSRMPTFTVRRYARAPTFRGGAMDETPSPQPFTLRTPYMDQGVGGDHFLATAGLLNVGIKVYAAGGENLLHNHPKEEHAFVVLEGRARFNFGGDDELEIGPLEGLMLPRGTNYCFANVSGGDTNLVMIRVGAAFPGEQYTPVYADGSVKGSDTEPNARVPRIERPGPGFGS